jgi:hypothetical protein
MKFHKDGKEREHEIRIYSATVYCTMILHFHRLGGRGLGVGCN